MRCTLREAERIFRTLQIEPRKCSHHVSGYFVIEGARALLAHFSFGRGEMPPPSVHRFRKSLLLTVVEFEALRDGRMTRAEYVGVVRPRLADGEA
jgi:hypothetical protein